jgi:hypothetical protein
VTDKYFGFFIKKEFYMSKADFDYSMGFDVFGITLFGKDYKKMTDMQVGLDYLDKFFQSSYFTGNKNPNVYIGMLAQRTSPSIVNAQIAGLGNGIKLAEMSESDVQKSADTLAQIAGSKVPVSIADFRQALVNQATSTPFWDMAVSATDNAVVQSLAKVGDTIIDTGKAVVNVAEAGVESVGVMARITSAMPYVVMAGGAYLLYKIITSDFTKEVAKSAVSGYTGGLARRK